MAAGQTQEITSRLRSIEGHVRAIERMVAEDAYCVDILRQSLAVQRALQKVNGLILDRHLNRCVSRIIRSGDEAERQRVLGEILEVFDARVGT